jgi:hypothetical protein
MNPQTLNRYSYCLNNPLKYTDPTGHVNVDSDDGGVPMDPYLQELFEQYQQYLDDNIGFTPYVGPVLPLEPNVEADTQPQQTNQELKDIKENPWPFFSGLFKASLATGLIVGGIVLAVFGSETIVGIGVGIGFVAVGYSFMEQGVNEASYGRTEWPEIPFLDEILRTSFDYFKDLPW